MSLELADEHRLQQVRLSAGVAALIGDLYRRIVSPSDLDRTFPVFVRATELVIGRGREVSWEVARDYYLAEAKAHGVAASAADLPVRPLTPAQLTASMESTGLAAAAKRLGKGASFGQAREAGAAAAMGSALRLIQNGGREFLVEVSLSDPHADGYARIGDGAPCSFCAMLISRGPVYTAETVNFRAHDGCGCGARLVYPSDTDEGWSAQASAMRALWNENGDPNLFRSALRRVYLSDPADLSAAERRVLKLAPAEAVQKARLTLAA